jgi:hypothetical protein
MKCFIFGGWDVGNFEVNFKIRLYPCGIMAIAGVGIILANGVTIF